MSGGYSGLVKGEECFVIFVLKLNQEYSKGDNLVVMQKRCAIIR